MPPLMSQPRQLHRLARQRLPLAGAARPRRSASRSIRASPPPRCSTTRTARWPASPPATWASARTASRRPASRRGMELHGKYTLFAEGARGSLAKQLIARVRARRGPRAAEVRHRPEGALAGRAGEAQARAWCSTRSAGRSTTRPAAARSSITSATTRWRSASSCTSTTRTPTSRRSRNSSASRHHPAIRADLRGRQAHRLWRARDHRGRLAVGAEARRFPAAR